MISLEYFEHIPEYFFFFYPYVFSLWGRVGKMSGRGGTSKEKARKVLSQKPVKVFSDEGRVISHKMLPL